MSLERIKNDGNYEPGNLRWATPLEQNSNKRNSDLVTYKGKTQTLTAWARDFGISQGALWNRLYKFNWSVEESLTRVPTRVTNRTLTEKEVLEIVRSKETHVVLAERFGVVQSQISRIRSGKRWGKVTGLG